MSALAEAGWQAVAAAGEPDDVACVHTVLTLLRHPREDVADWVAGTVLEAAQPIPDSELALVCGRRLPEPGIVAATVHALRAGDSRRVLDLAGAGSPGDYVDAVVHLLASASALTRWSADQ